MYGVKSNLKSEEALKADMMITKTFRDTSIQIIPISDKCYNEYYQKELEHTRKVRSTPIDILGFILLSGEQAMHQRAVFKELFNFDRLKKTLPCLRNIVKAHMEELKIKVENSPSQKLKIDFKNEVMTPLFEDISRQLVAVQRRG